jgi:LEA14-like dessication related protein
MRKVFILVGLGGLAYGIYNYYMKQLEILQNWDYRVIGGRIININLLKVTIQVDVEVTNDSAITITITDYYFDVFLNGVKVGVVKNASLNQRLEANGGKSFLPMIIELQTAEFLKSNVLLGLLESVKESTLTQKGYFGLKKGFVKYRNIPMEVSYKLKEFM